MVHRSPPTFARLPFDIRTLAAIAGLLVLSSCSREAVPRAAAGGGGRGTGPAAVSVTTAPVVEKPMPINVRAVGNVEASSTVDVRAQIGGELLSVNFTEGQEVAAGALLFTIDARPVEAALRQADAALTRDTAQAKSAEAQRARLASLLADGLIPQADYDVQAAAAATLQAAISADQAQIDSAKLQLQYTRIVAPVAGRTGALLVHKGSIVRAGDPAPLVVINRIAPAFVSFAAPARLLDRVRAGQRRGALTVTAAPPGGDAEGGSIGSVSFVDNAVDQSTDTIRLKATFPNGDHRLWPGAFVEVTMRLALEPRAIVIPGSAVQPGQQGEFVYVVKDDQTVEARKIAVAWIDGQETVIQQGLRAGEVVVTDGQLRLTPGAKVSVKSGARSAS
jgi:multidrug efflux system membrane fusion protein